MIYAILIFAIILTFISLSASINMGIRMEKETNWFRRDEFGYVLLIFFLCAVFWTVFFSMQGIIG